MNIIIDSPVYKRQMLLLEQQEQQQEQEQPEQQAKEYASLDDAVKDIVNPDSKGELEKMEKIKGILQSAAAQPPSEEAPVEGEVPPEEEMSDDELIGLNIDYSKINQYILQYKMIELYTDVKLYSLSRPRDSKVKDLMIMLKIILDLYHSFTYEDVFDKVEKLTKFYKTLKQKD